MNLSVRYIFISVNELGTAKTFFKEILGFEQLSSKIFFNQTHVVFQCGKNELNIMLCESKKETTATKLIIATDDCIKTYLKLRSNGVHFIQKPSYVENGLMANFLDPFGNEYSILEERDYSRGYL